MIRSTLIICLAGASLLGGCYLDDSAAKEQRDSLSRAYGELTAESNELKKRNKELEQRNLQQAANKANPVIQRKELADAERLNWKDNLSVSNVEWKNPVWGEAYVKGVLNNKATFMSYEDVVVEAHFLSSSGSSLAMQSQTIANEVLPLGNTPIKFYSVDWPPGTERVELVIVSARSKEPTRIQ